MNRLIQFAALLTTGLLASVAAHAASGTQRILSSDKACEMTVPANWTIDKWDSNNADAPDRSIRTGIDSPRPHVTLAQIKPIVQQNRPPEKTFEDSPQRLWYQSERDSYGIYWYVGVPRSGGVCSGTIIFKKASDAALAKQIALSVKPSS